MEKGEIKRGSDDALLILASLFYYRKPVRGRTRLQKIVFLLKNNYDIPFSFDFRPYYYGPYSDELSDLISFLNALNFTEERVEFLETGMIRYNYELTEKGRTYLEKFKKTADKETLETIRKLEKDIAELVKMGTPNLIAKAKSLMNNVLACSR